MSTCAAVVVCPAVDKRSRASWTAVLASDFRTTVQVPDVNVFPVAFVTPETGAAGDASLADVLHGRHRTSLRDFSSGQERADLPRRLLGRRRRSPYKQGDGHARSRQPSQVGAKQ